MPHIALSAEHEMHREQIFTESLTAALGVPLTVSPVPRLRELAELGVLAVTCFDQGDLLSIVGLNGLNLVIVHAELGGRDPCELIQGIRHRSNCPVLLLKRGGEQEDSVDLTPADAVLRDDVPLASQLQRWLPTSPPSSGLRWGPLVLDRRTRRASWDGGELPLTSQQFRVLSALAEAAGGLVRVDDLSESVYEGHVGADRQRLMAHIRRIRRLIEPEPAHPRFLLTVRGEGFRLADDLDGRDTR